MTIKELFAEFELTGKISNESVKYLQSNQELRLELVNNNTKRDFVIYLLTRFIELRKDAEFELWIEDLMFASYLVAKHSKIDDSIIIAAAKFADFDTYCGMDGELIAFAGRKETIDYFKVFDTEDTKMAIEYLEGYDDEEIKTYFLTVHNSWWI